MTQFQHSPGKKRSSKKKKLQGGRKKSPYSNAWQIHRLITVGEFKRRVKKDADNIFLDFDVKYALQRLQAISRGNSDAAQRLAAETILKDVGLSAFIPTGSRGALKAFRESPALFFAMLGLIETRLRDIIGNGPRTQESIRKAANTILGRSLDKRLPNEPRATLSFKDTSLRILALENGRPFMTILNLHTKLKKENVHKKQSISRKLLMEYAKAYKEYVVREHFGKEEAEAFRMLNLTVHGLLVSPGDI